MASCAGSAHHAEQEVGAVLAPQCSTRQLRFPTRLPQSLPGCLSRESSKTSSPSAQRPARTSWPLLRSGRARPTRKRRWWPPAFTIGCRHSCSSPSPLAPLPIAARASRSVACARCKRSAPGFWATCPTCRLTPTLTPTPPQNPNASTPTPTPTPTLAVTPALTFIRLTRMRWCKREASTH